MNAQRNTLIGLFFVVVTGILGWFTLFKSDLSLFADSYPMIAYFSQGGGLREGDSVLVAGMRWGRVVEMDFDPERDLDRRVEVKFSLQHDVTLYRDHVIEIQDATVLGGKRLSIEPGRQIQAIWEGDLLGTVKPNVMESVGDLVNELEDVTADLKGGEGVIGKLISDDELAKEVEDAVEAIKGTFENLQVLTDENGPLGTFLADEAMYATIQRIADGLQVLVQGLENHEGVLGALLDENHPMLTDATEALASLNKIVTEAQAGTGTLGMLLNDEKMRQNLERIVDDLEQGEGTIGKLLKDDEVYDKLTEVIDDLVTVADRLESGQGTLGMLVNDREIYNEMLDAVRLLTGSLEEAREAAPISTFLNTVFLGF